MKSLSCENLNFGLVGVYSNSKDSDIFEEAFSGVIRSAGCSFAGYGFDGESMGGYSIIL